MEKVYNEPPANLFKKIILPSGLIGYMGIAGNFKGLSVIVTEEMLGNNGKVIHISLARNDRLPSYDEMKYIKNLILGQDKMAVQLFPPASEHVNIQEYCLHLWHGLNEAGWKEICLGK